MQRDLPIVRSLICLVAFSLALTACTEEQVAGGILEAGVLADPDNMYHCLHGLLDELNGENEGTCWVLRHLRYAQHFCLPELEKEVHQPHRWEEQSVSDPMLKALIKVVPGSAPMLRGGTPAFHSYLWSGPELGHMTLLGAYDLQSRTGLNEWTPLAYSCVYDTFRYEVIGVEVGPVPDQ